VPTPQELKIREMELQLRREELELERLRLQNGAASDGDELSSSEGKGGRFRLLAGGHVDPRGKEYKSGQIVTATNDLQLKFGADKFQRLSVIHEGGGKPAKAAVPVEPTPPSHDASDVVPKTAADLPPVDPAVETETDEYGDEAKVGGEGFENLDGMSIAELKELAEGEEIDLAGATKKADIVARIKAAKKG